MKKIIKIALIIAAILTILPTHAQAEPSEIKFQTISVSYWGSMALKADDSLWAWGGNEYGQIGNGNRDDQFVPVKVMDDVASVSTSNGYTMAIKKDGSLWGWGVNEYGQIGTGKPSSSKNFFSKKNPVKVMDDVISVSAGNGYTMAIKKDGSLWGWGWNLYGQFGDVADIGYQLTPVKLMENVAYVSGRYHIIVIKTDGSLWAWGWKGFGNFDDVGERQNFVPVKLMENVVSASDGYFHIMAVKGDGSLWALGDNTCGQLGDGTTKGRRKPVKVMDNVVSVSAFSYHTMAIKTDGSLWAWGENDLGQLGNGKKAYSKLPPETVTNEDVENPLKAANQLTPIKVMDNVVSVSTGDRHTLAVKADGSLWTWGNNEYGRLGNGNTTEVLTPIKIMDGVKIPTTFKIRN